ncbi:MAG: transcriptional regulator [SAR86 cluster bacterium]|uniref:Transcriptional regulator n=1 Tax=SAR86 cluster bacterium TaxID=2030880 RepID=A0A2A5B728_9GAMM|nr:MAG: transcriptional regulator [SAR86 cluster bacterium]
MNPISIGKLSSATSVNIEAIRYYEREGILPEPLRNQGGWRIYFGEDVKRLKFIHKCRELGFSLKEIKSLLSLVYSGNFTCKEVHDLTLEHAKKIHQKISNLKKMEAVLVEMASQCSRENVPDCPIVDSLYH